MTYDRSVMERYEAKVDRSAGPHGCHIWTAAKSGAGYGQIRIEGPVRYAHRVALEIKLGRRLRADEHALHDCDTPACVNPDHLHVGDHALNMRECIERGRHNMDGLALGRAPGKTAGLYRTGPELCGTIAGYARHRRHGEPYCDECRAATRRYHQERRVRG